MIQNRCTTGTKSSKLYTTSLVKISFRDCRGTELYQKCTMTLLKLQQLALLAAQHQCRIRWHLCRLPPGALGFCACGHGCGIVCFGCPQTRPRPRRGQSKQLSCACCRRKYQTWLRGWQQLKSQMCSSACTVGGAVNELWLCSSCCGGCTLFVLSPCCR